MRSWKAVRDKGLRALRFCWQKVANSHLGMGGLDSYADVQLTLQARDLATLHPSICFLYSLRDHCCFLVPGLAGKVGCLLSGRPGSASPTSPGRRDADLQSIRSIGFSALSMNAST